MVTTSRLRWPGAALRAVVAIGTVVVLASACGGNEVELPERQSRATSPAAPPSPTVDPEHVPILAAYAAYIEAYDEAARQGDPDHPGLAEHSEGLALETAQSAIGSYVNTNWVYTGGRTIVWAEVDLGSGTDATVQPDVPEGATVTSLAGVHACLDVSEFLPADADDGSLLATAREVEVHEAEATLRFDESQGRWLVILASLDWETPC